MKYFIFHTIILLQFFHHDQLLHPPPLGVPKYPTFQFLIFSAPHPSLYTPRALHMNFQVPSYPLAIRTGYSLFSLKIQRILRIFWSEAVYLILFGVKSFKCVFNDRICFPHVQTISLTPKKNLNTSQGIWTSWILCTWSTALHSGGSTGFICKKIRNLPFFRHICRSINMNKSIELHRIVNLILIRKMFLR